MHFTEDYCDTVLSYHKFALSRMKAELHGKNVPFFVSVFSLLCGKLTDDPGLDVCFNLTNRGFYSTAPVLSENLHIVYHFPKSSLTEVTMNLQLKRITRQWCHNNVQDY